MQNIFLFASKGMILDPVASNTRVYYTFTISAIASVALRAFANVTSFSVSAHSVNMTMRTISLAFIHICNRMTFKSTVATSMVGRYRESNRIEIKISRS